MDAAEKHHNRYKAVLGKLPGASIKLSALEVWARKKDWPVSFTQLFGYEGEHTSPPPDRDFIDIQLVDVKVADWFAKVADEHAIAEYARRWNAVRRGDREAAHTAMLAEVFYRVLCAVFDGELMMYDPACFPIDVSEERLRYEEAPETFMPPVDPCMGTLPTPGLPRQRAQEEAILAALREHGQDPRAMPRPRKGEAGVKADMREVLLHQKAIFVSKRTFDQAWQRLRDDGEIADAT